MWSNDDARSEATQGRQSVPELIERLLAAAARQQERELASGYDVDVGLLAIAEATDAIRALGRRTWTGPDALAHALADRLFDLMREFIARGPQGRYASAASSLGSLIHQFNAELGDEWPGLRQALASGWTSLS